MRNDGPIEGAREKVDFTAPRRRSGVPRVAERVHTANALRLDPGVDKNNAPALCTGERPGCAVRAALVDDAASQLALDDCLMSTNR